MIDVLSPNPKVYVIARPRLEVGLEEFLEDHGLHWVRSPTATEAEQIVEIAGRICYLSFGARQSPKTNAEYIRHLIQSGHHSVLEHVSWTMLLSGVSRAFTHQLVRHRVGFAFSQLSQQYHDESDAEYVVPHEIIANSGALSIWQTHMDASREAYKRLLGLVTDTDAQGSARERNRAIRSAARSVLPNATETKLAMSVNARPWPLMLPHSSTTSPSSDWMMVHRRLFTGLRLDELTSRYRPSWQLY